MTDRLSVPRRIPTQLHGPECNFGERYGVPPSCALLGRFAIGARVCCYGNIHTSVFYWLKACAFFAVAKGTAVKVGNRYMNYC